MVRQERFLSRQASQRRSRLLSAGRHATTTSSGKVLDLDRAATAISGDIFLMSTGSGVVLNRNPFPAELVNKLVAWTPTDAAATKYTLAVTDGSFREDAVGDGIPDLMNPVSDAALTDDDSREFALPFPFSFYGKSYNTIYVNSNGHLSFEEPNQSAEFLDYSDFLTGAPKIMGAGVDLDPEFSPAEAGTFVFSNDTEFIVSYVKVAQFWSFDEQVDFQIRLGADGKISFFHRSAPTGLFVMGISPGRSLDPGNPISYVQPPGGESGGSYAEIFSDLTNGEVDVARVSQVFYQTQPDDYDYIVVYNNLGIPAGPGAVAFMLPIRNSATGFGDEDVDRGLDFGSSARLQAFLQMGPLGQYPDSPIGLVNARADSLDTPLTVLAHEAGHRFLAFTTLREGGSDTFNLLGRANAHWSYNFNSHGSFLEGNHVQTTPSASAFLTGNPNQRYSELDRYLMGLIPPHEVGVEQQLFYVAGSSKSKNIPPEVGQDITGTRTDFNVDQVIAANGPRIPDHTVAQKRYRFAFILITEDATAPVDALTKINAFRTEFETFFHDKTSGLAIADTSLKPGLNANLFPAGGFGQGTSGELVISRAKATDAAVPLQIAVTGDAATLPGTAEIPANATSVTIPVNAPNAGVSAVAVSASNNEYLPAAFHIAVSNADQLSMQVLSGLRYEAAPNATVATPVTVRVTDKNRVPYQGVEVRFEATSGGSANPATGVTDANGEVSFTWTVGDSAQNSGKVFLAASRGTSEVTLTAVENLRPKTFAATNGANFVTGLSPGSLATLFGISLAAGTTASAPGLPLPLELEGVSVEVNGVTCQLLYVSDLQVNFFVPGSLNGTVAQILVTTPDGTSDEFVAPLNQFDPAIFFDSGTNLGAVLLHGSGMKTDLVPAQPGKFIEIYATGLGPTVPGGRGKPTRTEKPVTATLNGVELLVDFSGLTSNFVGLYQVNAKLPEGLTPGTYLLRLQVEGKESNAVNVIVGPVTP